MIIKQKDKTCKDHLGHPFACVRDMYLFWGLTEWVYYNRKHAGWPLEKILTTPLREMRNNAFNDFQSYGRHRKNKKPYEYYKKISEVKKEFAGGYIVITEYQKWLSLKI